jgi:predicted NAD/FAD-binding protein
MKRIAIVGSGGAGLSAALRLQEHAEITVFEASTRAGGHIHAVPVQDASSPTGEYWIDTGFIAWSPQLYPNAYALFQSLGLSSAPSGYPVVAWDRRSGVSVPLSSFPSRCGKDFAPEVGRDLRRLVILLMKSGNRLDPVEEPLSFGDWLQRENFHVDLIEHLILPAMAVVWGFQVNEILEMSAGAATGLMRRTMFTDTGVEFRRLTPSSHSYLLAVVNRLHKPVRTGCAVNQVSLTASGVEIQTGSGTEQFDRVILAAQPFQNLQVLAAPTEKQREILGGMTYHRSAAIVHRDAALLPPDPAHQSAFIPTWLPETKPGRRRSCATWNMSAYYDLPTTDPILVTICATDDAVPGVLVAADKIQHVIHNTHVSLTPFYQAARAALAEIEIPGRVYFAGSWLGPVGSHECAVTSGLNAAARLARDI